MSYRKYLTNRTAESRWRHAQEARIFGVEKGSRPFWAKEILKVTYMKNLTWIKALCWLLEYLPMWNSRLNIFLSILMEKNIRVSPAIFPRTPKHCLLRGQFLFSVPFRFCQNKRAEFTESSHIDSGKERAENILWIISLIGVVKVVLLSN